jgi:hypothetical protein
METILPLHVDNTEKWALLTCPHHTAGDIELRQQGAFKEVRCRECARAEGGR